VSVLGSAVADLTHLVAELVENATGFSPPHTRVLVSGEQVGAGYALDIEDRGLGMSREAIAEANLRIAEGQQSDLFDSNQLGLFVVSRLARRHGIRVSLRTSPYGGTTAVLLLPMAVLSVEQQPGARPAPVREAERADEVAPAAARRFPERSRGTFAQVRTLNRIASANPNPNPAAGRAATAEPELEAESAHELEPSPAAERSLESAAPVEEELPLRVRQASLAAQLRDVPGRDAPDEGVPEARDAGRSPERVRATMAAMADGWARGRSADLPPGAPDRPGAPGHGDTPARTDDRT
jgi:hypothetical protein